MIERLIARRISPVLQFDVDFPPMFKEINEINELPERKRIIHLSASTDILRAKRGLGGKFCIAGNVEFESLAKEDIEHSLKEMARKCDKRGFILSTSGGSPIVLSKSNVDDLKDKLASIASMLGTLYTIS